MDTLLRASQDSLGNGIFPKCEAEATPDHHSIGVIGAFCRIKPNHPRGAM